MFKRLFIFIGLLVFSGLFSQKTYVVVKGDTPYSIAKKFGMTVDDLAKLNPSVASGKISIGESLKVSGKAVAATPTSTQTKPAAETSGKLGTIVLQPKQTIYGITKQYHISEADLRKLNPNLDSEMKIGNQITLPLANIKKYADDKALPSTEEKIAEQSAPTQTIAQPLDENSYTVQAKDNYYRITKKFGITQDQLFALNPGLEQKGLRPGDTIIIKGNPSQNQASSKPVKSTSQTVSSGSADDYVTYTVQDGDTVFGILNRHNISLDELLALNPDLNNGLRAGMVLKIKKLDAHYAKKSGEALNVIFMLPFGFDDGDSKYRSMSSDFLAGAKVAIERNAEKGLKMDVKVVDVGNESSFKKNLIQINPDNTDLIIGPFFKSNVLEVLDYVNSRKIPVVAPFANSEDLFDYNNLVIVEPENKTFADKIASEVAKVYSGQKIYIVGDANGDDVKFLKQYLKEDVKNATPLVVVSPSEIKLDKNMMTGQTAPVIAILADEDSDVGSQFAAKMIELGQETDGVKSFSMFYQPAFEKNIDGLGKSSLVYLMDRKIVTDGDFEKQILAAYKKKYCKTPSKYAVIGFDVVNDILSRENKMGELFKQISKTQTQLATKFEYVRAKDNGAYINTGYRVVRLVP